MSSDTQQSKSGMLATTAWIVGALIAVYFLGFAVILFSGGRVARALDSVGISGRFLDFLYGLLIDLLES
jgi:hypothetical protein